MKILLVNKFHYIKGGSETYYFALAEAFRYCGHEVIFFSVQDERNVICEQAPYFVSNRSVSGSLKSKINLLLHLTYSKEAYSKMKKLLADEKPDLVILNLIHKHITLAVIDAVKASNPDVPVFWTMHDLSAICPAYTMRDGKGRICEKCIHGDYSHCLKNNCIKGNRLMSLLSMYEAKYIHKMDWYNQVDLYICPSEFYRKKFEESGFSCRPVITMRNPLPVETNYEISGKDYGYLLYFGRLSKEKGIKTLIDAVNRSGYRLFIVGTGPQGEELREYAKNNANILFAGFQSGEALRNYVRNSRCVILPSEWYENGPYSAMEAMAMGKPLIVSGYGGLPELVENGVNGYIYRQGSEELAECITRMMTLSEEDYQTMSRNALEKAKTMFSPEAYVERIETYYREIHK